MKGILICSTLSLFAAALVAQNAATSTPPQDSGDARSHLYRYIDSLARTQLDARQRTIAQVRTRQAAERRQAEVREKVLKLIGGLPERSGSIAAKEFGSIPGDGFRMEKIAYESLPDFWVTANLYVPASGDGPFPAIVLAPGHGAGGKSENWSWGANFARNGIVTLAYDPIGQGERLRYYDAERKASFIGNPTGEHGEANIGPMLLGDTIARYMVNDAMRGVDYLISRKDIDATRIGAFGCSGGGTMTARSNVKPSDITVYGKGPLGIVALHAAVLDARISRVVLENTLVSYRAIVDEPVHRNVSEVVIPGVLRTYDTGDLLVAVSPRRVSILSPQDPLGEPISELEYRATLLHVFQSEERLGSGQRIRFTSQLKSALRGKD